MMKIFYKLLSWLIALVLPVVIILSVVRVMINPWYLDFEYRTPGFPPDPYGFSLQDRLEYGKLAARYLVNEAGISFLADLRFPPGQQVPEPSCQFMSDCSHLYNERELQHMLDVKNVVHGAMLVLEVGLVLLVLLAIWAWRGRWPDDYLKGLQRGGIFVLAFIGFVIAFVLVAFNVIFVIFHEIFFKAGTWTFLYTDTLIRLFPERFWQDTFLMVGGLSIAIGLSFYFAVKKIRRQLIKVNK
ncbi:MAG: TIGR01906 family membrane protein [Acidobacteriaceae bacterium]